MKTYYIYRAFYYTHNESSARNNGKAYANDCKSLELVATINGEFFNAYMKAKEFRDELMQDGWSLVLNSRSEGYSNDNFMKLENGEDWKDGRSADIIYSTSPLALQTR